MASWKGWIAIGAIAVGTAIASCGADPAGCEDSSLPLRSAGGTIVDAHGEAVKLSAVSWRGAEGPDYVVSGLDQKKLRDMAAQAKKDGFNTVRIAWSNELLLLGSLTTVDPSRVAANPELKGKTGLEVFDAAVKAATAAGLMVILDNAASDTAHADGRWYTADYPEEKWIADWRAMAHRYAKNPLVVAADLRSGLHLEGPAAPVTMGNPVGVPQTPPQAWAAAAERATRAIAEANPNLLVIEE